MATWGGYPTVPSQEPAEAPSCLPGSRVNPAPGTALATVNTTGAEGAVKPYPFELLGPTRSLRDKSRLRIAVIGTGVAGIGCALALQGVHDVIVFERDTALGGHAHSVAVSHDGLSPTGVRVSRVATLADAAGASHADVGATFFNKPDYPVFMRMLAMLGCKVDNMNGTVSILPYGAKHPLCIPFTRGGGLVAKGVTPRVGVWGARLQAVLKRAQKQLAGVPLDYLTLAEFLLKTKFDPLPDEATASAQALAAAQRRRKEQLEAAGRRLAAKPFYDQFLLPLVQSFWGTTRALVLGFSAGGCFAYLVGNFAATPCEGAKLAEVRGGLGVYTGKASEQLTRTGAQVRTSCTVTGIKYDAAARTYAVESRRTPPPAPGSEYGQPAAGYDPEKGPTVVHPEGFDAVVVATNAWQANRLLQGVPHAGPMQEALRRVTYEPSFIGIHGDMSVLAKREKERSLVNIQIVPEARNLDEPIPSGDGCCTCGFGAGKPGKGTMRGFFTAYKPWHFQPGLPALKTWLDPALVRRPELLPQPMYLLQSYYHAMPDLEFYKLPARLEPLQGTKGLFLAGMHCGGNNSIDNHETALVSGMRVAARLAPQSPVLQQLWPEGARAAPKRAEACQRRMRDEAERAVEALRDLTEEGVRVVGRAVQWL